VRPKHKYTKVTLVFIELCTLRAFSIPLHLSRKIMQIFHKDNARGACNTHIRTRTHTHTYTHTHTHTYTHTYTHTHTHIHTYTHTQVNRQS